MKRFSKHLSQIIISIIILVLLVSFSFTIIATAQTPIESPTSPVSTPYLTPSSSSTITPLSSITPSATSAPPISGQAINPGWTPPTLAASPTTTQSTTKVVADVKPAVVAINVSIPSVDYFNQPITQQGAGSGWVIDSSGIIVTNNHVVEGANSINIILNDGHVFPATMVATDPVTDLAVVKINTSNLTAVAVGNSNNLAVGQTVVSIGNSLGMGISATQGIVSALNITINPGTEPLYGLIQTDAAINPGNSGGPLLDLSEEVVGINSIKVAQAGVEGMGYAISINEAMPIIQQLIQKGSVTRPFVGVALQTVTPEIAATFNLAVDQGALIVSVVSGSPAEQARLQQGDIIVSINGTAVVTSADATRIIRSSQVGQQLQISYYRGSSQATATVTTVESPSPSLLPSVSP